MRQVMLAVLPLLLHLLPVDLLYNRLGEGPALGQFLLLQRLFVLEDEQLHLLGDDFLELADDHVDRVVRLAQVQPHLGQHGEQHAGELGQRRTELLYVLHSLGHLVIYET